MEHGVTAELSLENGRLALPELKSGNECIDEVIRTAWLGNYSRTSDMVQYLALIYSQINHFAKSTEVLHDLEDLKTQVMDWSNYRKLYFGRAIPYHVLKCHLCPLTFLQDASSRGFFQSSN